MNSMATDSVAGGVPVEVGPADFAQFFRAEYQTLLRAMYLITGDRHQAEELAQDAFVKACERWERIRDMQNPTGYLYRTAVNAHRSALRRIAVAARHVFVHQERDPISATDDRDRIRRALATLPAGQRHAIVLVEWLGMTDAEAGDVLGVSAGAVRVRISRARAALRLEPERPES
jgi:RNA polymerase sigma-70 factor (sigma-E family)